MPTELSSGLVYYPKVHQEWAVYAYDPHTSTWTKLRDINWREVSSPGHSAYLIEATAPQPTVASTYRVIIEVFGSSVEIFMTPTVTQRLITGEVATLRINLF